MSKPTSNRVDFEPEMEADNVLETALRAVSLMNPVIDLEDGRHNVILPDGYSLTSVTDPDRLSNHIKQAVTVDDRNSLEIYTNRFSDDRTILIADLDNDRIRSVLDWHNDNEHDLSPQHATHTATLQLRKSEEFKRWNEMENTLHSQEEFAMFIEENVADVASPDHSDLLEICRELEASQGAMFKSGTRLDNGDRSFTYETQTHVKNDLKVPNEITLMIPIYHGEEPVEVKAKFRFRPRADGLKLGFTWHRVEYQRQAVFNAMAYAASEATGRPLIFGRC